MQPVSTLHMVLKAAAVGILLATYSTLELSLSPVHLCHVTPHISGLGEALGTEGAVIRIDSLV